MIAVVVVFFLLLFNVIAPLLNLTFEYFTFFTCHLHQKRWHVNDFSRRSEKTMRRFLNKSVKYKISMRLKLLLIMIIINLVQSE